MLPELADRLQHHSGGGRGAADISRFGEREDGLRQLTPHPDLIAGTLICRRQPRLPSVRVSSILAEPAARARQLALTVLARGTHLQHPDLTRSASHPYV